MREEYIKPEYDARYTVNKPRKKKKPKLARKQLEEINRRNEIKSIKW